MKACVSTLWEESDSLQEFGGLHLPWMQYAEEIVRNLPACALSWCAPGHQANQTAQHCASVWKDP